MSLNALIENKKTFFWLLNIAGWATFSIITYLAAIYWGSEWGFAWARIAVAVVGMTLALLLRFIYRKIWNRNWWLKAVAVAVGSYMSAAVLAVVFNIVLWDFYEQCCETPIPLLKYFKGVTYYIYVFLCWSALYFGIKFYQEMQLAHQSALKAHSLAHQAQLKMLRYQLNPHFLFNTLNAISTLILEIDTQRANDMVTRLSNFLRYSLDNDPMQKVSLEQEINTLKLYLGIEKVRFEERLKLELNIEDNALGAFIPSLLLQPLIENSIKYAIAQSETGGTLFINAKVFANELLIEVADDGPGIQGSQTNHCKGSGVGINNIRNRLSELYGSNYTFHIKNRQPCGLQISIRLPYETEKNQ